VRPGSCWSPGASVGNTGQATLQKTLVVGNAAGANGAFGVAQGGGINNVSVGGPPPQLTVANGVVTANRLTGSPGITLQGGGIFTAFPVTLTGTVIAGKPTGSVLRVLSNSGRMWPRATPALVAVVLVAAATACGGAGVDKAGGPAATKPVVLTLAAHDDDYAFGSFAAAVERISGGSMRINVVNSWRNYEVDYERGIVDDVRTGRVQLGIVGVRVWDTLGVTSFRALVAPFLVDSLPLERRAWRARSRAGALAGVERRGSRRYRPSARPAAQAVRDHARPRRTGGLRGRDDRGPYRRRSRARRSVRWARRPGGTYPAALSGVDGADLDPATIVLTATTSPLAPSPPTWFSGPRRRRSS
jgi:hypothetical protein